MQALTEDAGRRQGSNASKISNVGPRMGTFLTINEGDPSQRSTKRKLLLLMLGCIPRRSQMCLGCSEYTKTTRSHLIRCSGIEVAISGLYKGLAEYHRPEQGSYTWLDVVLNDKALINKPEAREAIRGGMGWL